jgi:hypothetical protein
MRIIDLIKKLEDLYCTYDDEYKHHMGEPEIMIDCFELDDTGNNIQYKGFMKDIYIDKSADGVYDILRAFNIEDPKNDR